MQENPNENNEWVDPRIYKQANKRVAFKTHLVVYLLAMVVIWIIYAFVFRNESKPVDGGFTYLRFAAFVTALWTVLVIAHYLFVYQLNHNMLDKEIKKVKKEIEKKEAELERLKKSNATSAENDNPAH